MPHMDVPMHHHVRGDILERYQRHAQAELKDRFVIDTE